MEKIKRWKREHPDLFEFIMFNIMSNVATVTNFCVLWLGNGFLFRNFANRQFDWFIFHYSLDEGGLSGFLSFLLAYLCAQIVNFFVQRKMVFGATVKISRVLPWYVLTVTVAGILSVWMPPYIIAITVGRFGGLAPTIANVVNIIAQVLINYPMMKLVIMKK